MIPAISARPNNKNTKTSIFYINDLHGQDIRMEKLVNASRQFDTFTIDADKLKLASGDITLGENEKNAQVANKFLNIAGIMATSLGNHECDSPKAFLNFVKNRTFNLLAANINPIKDNFAYGIVDKSYIQEIDGDKYGIIGLAPVDMAKHLKIPENVNSLNVSDFDKTVTDVQAEVDKLTQQGVNKIILLSHSGYENDVKLAKTVKGLDVILGGHTHHLLESVEENKNLFYSPSGEPVVITQAGGDGKNFGVLNLEFNDGGVITKVQNNIGDTDSYSRNLIAKYLFEVILGKPQKVGRLQFVEKYTNDPYGSENAQASFLLDAMKNVLKVDGAVLNSTTIRGYLESGSVDTRDLARVSPWGNQLVILDITEKELVDAVKARVNETMQSSIHRPGILQVSGFKYEFTKSGELKSMSFVNKDGVENKIDINNPRTNKTYKITTDDFCAKSADTGLNLISKLDTAKKADYDVVSLMAEYIKSKNGTAEIKKDGRIKVLDTVKQVTFGANPDGTVDTSIFYINDLHGKLNNMERICSMSNQFDAIKTNADKLKLASGDIMLGSNLLKNKVAAQFLNWIGVTANALGNHEMDCTPDALAGILVDAKFGLMALNATVSSDSAMFGKLKHSIIEEHNGEKYGIMGIAPPDALERVGTRESLNEISIDDIDITIKKVQEETDKLKSQGVNKIILLSHVGYESDKRIARETSGIDVILGGHTHNKITGITEGENLLYSKSGEPVVITQAGKDGENIGVLNLKFNSDGIITKVQNNVTKTIQYNRTLPYRYSVEDIIGKPEVLGQVSYVEPSPKNRLIEPNPHGNIIADAMRIELDTDIALLNAANLRGEFTKGSVDSRKIDDITPFEDKMIIAELSEKQIVDAIKVGGKSFAKEGNKPGIILVSGLEYKMNDKGELLEMKYIDRTGQKSSIDVNNPSPIRKFTVALDDFMAYGGDYYLPVDSNPSYVLKKFDVDKNIYTANYIKKMTKPLEVKDDCRVQIVKS